MNQPGKTEGSTSTGLLRRLRAGDNQAWDDLVKRYGPLIYGFARDAGVPASDIDDILQLVLLGFVRRAATLKATSFRGWLRVCTQRRAADYHRRRKRRLSGAAVGGSEFAQQLANHPAAEDHADSSADNVVARFIENMCRADEEGSQQRLKLFLNNPAPPADWCSTDDVETTDSTRRSTQLLASVLPVFGTMTERCRLAFTRVAILGQNAAEVARDLNMGVGAVHQCVSRTRDRLRKALFKSEPNSAQPAADDSDKLGD